MGDCQAQRIGRVLAGQAGQLQQALDHFLHLGLAGLAIARDGLLHLQSRVFGHRQVAGDQRRGAGAPGLAEQQGGLRVDVDENDFDRRRIGLVA